MMIAPTEILFFRWVTLTEQKWVTFRERRRPESMRPNSPHNPAVEPVDVWRQLERLFSDNYLTVFTPEGRAGSEDAGEARLQQPGMARTR
jgi:hypothetical protein